MKATFILLISHLKLKFGLLIPLLKSLLCLSIVLRKKYKIRNAVSRERVWDNGKDGPFLLLLLTILFILPACVLAPFSTLPRILHMKRLKMYILNHNKNTPNKALLESNLSHQGAFHICNLILCLETFISGKKLDILTEYIIVCFPSPPPLHSSRTH